MEEGEHTCAVPKCVGLDMPYGRLIRGWHRKIPRLVLVGKWSGVITWPLQSSSDFAFGSDCGTCMAACR
jgi:hypothetical protein